MTTLRTGDRVRISAESAVPGQRIETTGVFIGVVFRGEDVMLEVDPDPGPLSLPRLLCRRGDLSPIK